jgi:hypothetical protein
MVSTFGAGGREVRRTKTESLTIRLEPRTRFMLEFVSRARGQPLTTVIERAVAETADQVSVKVADREAKAVGWRDIWSVNEGERALRFASLPDLYPTFEEEKRLSFCREHWPFFFKQQYSYDEFLTYYLNVLWSCIDEFVKIHEDKKREDYFAAGKAMQKVLLAAQLEPPDWPPAPTIYDV